MTPGNYIRLRRIHAGLFQQAVADAIGVARKLYWKMEAGKKPFTEEHIQALLMIFPFDPDVVAALAAGESVQVCRACACSYRDPCDDGVDSACGWAEPDLCTACARKTEAA